MAVVRLVAAIVLGVIVGGLVNMGLILMLARPRLQAPASRRSSA